MFTFDRPLRPAGPTGSVADEMLVKFTNAARVKETPYRSRQEPRRKLEESSAISAGSECFASGTDG